MIKISIRATFVIAFTVLTLLLSSDAKAAPGSNNSGVVIDCSTHLPIAGAWVTDGQHAQRTDAAGAFQIESNAQEVLVRAIGYGRGRLVARRDMRIELEPIEVRGLYLSFWGVSSPALRDGVLNTINMAHLNSIVIDVKGDRGLVSLKATSTVAAKIGASKINTFRNAPELIRELHNRGIYCIARIVVFKDDPLARSLPELAVKTASGHLFVDREGLAWTDPFKHAVWEYNISLAREAATAGFDEIQFDYVRFPDQKGLQFSKPNDEANRRQAITDFLGAARRALVPHNVFLSADNFGYVCWNRNDTGIGQCFSYIGSVADYISPMLYPSSFQYGIPGLRNPLQDPYRVVYSSLLRAIERTGFSPLTFRPWLQAFDDYAFDRRRFGKQQLKAQIKAAQDAGSSGWMLWDPRNRYDASILAELSSELHWRPARDHQ